MADVEFPHLFVPDSAASQDFTTPRLGRDSVRFPDRSDRKQHGSFVRKALDAAWTASKATQDHRRSVSLPTRAGTYIEFESAPDFDLKTKSLDLRQSGIRLLNVSTALTDDEKAVTHATIFVPAGKEAILLKKVDEYTSGDIKKGKKPKHEPLVAGIENLREAILDSFWRDQPSLIPETKDWCEVWLRYSDDPEPIVGEFKETCSSLSLDVEEGHLTFPERVVVLVNAAAEDLRELIQSSDYIAEFRRAKATAEFWMDLDNADQSEAANDLAGRISVENLNNTAICMLDTGVNNGHVLLTPMIDDDDCHSVNAEWGSADTYGHGTLMCGVAAYGAKLDRLLQSKDEVTIPYNIESVKLIPAPGSHHEKKLYGLRTKQALSRAEIQNSDCNRTVCLAVSSDDDRDHGRPTSWSGSVDQLCAGVDDGRKRLIVIASGNILDSSEWMRYPESNITQAVHDPGQSWNAITVGAYTEKTEISDDELAKTYKPVARSGELSPFSTTSHIWEAKWPNKPDVVFEGGNAGIDEASGLATELDDLSILSTHHKPQDAQFSTMNATSAAAAQAARFAAYLSAQYPNAWPETIRGLMVHSAGWTAGLLEQVKQESKTEKWNYARLLRTCGFGYPNFGKAVQSASNSLTLVCEQSIQPFKKKGTGNDYETKDMHLVELPWPKNALKDLPPNTPVKINITLSYFVEPGPGEIGWRDKYRYRSHGLDFELMGPTETKDEFLKRLNKAARDDDPYDGGASTIDWSIGSQARNKGSIHRDWWVTSAENAAACNVIGIFPRTGWWKERSHLKKGNSKSRYSLIVSVETPSTKVDIYTPVATAISTPIEITTETPTT